MKRMVLAAAAATGLAGQADAATFVDFNFGAFSEYGLVIEFGDLGYAVTQKDRILFHLADKWFWRPNGEVYFRYAQDPGLPVHYSFAFVVEDEKLDAYGWDYRIYADTIWNDVQTLTFSDERYSLYYLDIPITDISFAPVPLPASAPLLLAGAAGLFGLRRLRSWRR